MSIAESQITEIPTAGPNTQATSAGLEVVDVRKSFVSPQGNRIEVLRGITLQLKPGEAVAITGPSGSGKSTLLHLLGGLEKPDHGMIVVNGTDLGHLTARSLSTFRQHQIGFVFQFHYLLNDLTAVENVALPLRIRRQQGVAVQNLAEELLTSMGLEGRLHHPVSHLSGGEQQRVAVARALIGRPQLLLADEPTGNLDASIGEEIGKSLVNYAHEQGGMVVIATHNEGLAGLCDRTMLLEKGKVGVFSVSNPEI